MAITQVTIKTTEVETQRIGYSGISLTNILNSTEPLIASGSVIEIGGSLYEIDSNTDIDPANDLAGISNGNMVWMYINASTLQSYVTTTEPIWSEEKQGWYDATETYRYYGCVFKDSSGNFTNKQILGGRFWSPKIFITDNYTISDEFINMKIILDSSVAANKTATLPTLSDNIGKVIIFENRDDTYQLIIEGEGAETINTLTTGYLGREYQTVTIEANTSEWQIIDGSIFDNTGYQTYTRTGLSNATDSAHYGYCEFFANGMIRYHMWGWIQGDGVSSSPVATYTLHRTLTETTKANIHGISAGYITGSDPTNIFNVTGAGNLSTFSSMAITASTTIDIGGVKTDGTAVGGTLRIVYSTQIESEL